MKKCRQPIEPLVLDVRPILAGGGSPCEPIDRAVGKLKQGQSLVLIVPFEPVPLYAKLAREGFSHSSQSLPDGVWRIEFHRDEKAAAQRSPSKASANPAEEIRLDCRGLEPPEPLVRTLEALHQIASAGKIVMRSDRKPLHLFEELETRGFLFDCTEQDDHSFITNIWNARDA